MTDEYTNTRIFTLADVLEGGDYLFKMAINKFVEIVDVPGKEVEENE